MITVGRLGEREVSELNHELFKEAKSFLETSADEKCRTGYGRAWHVGWLDIGEYIDFLEANYEITRKNK